MPVLQHNRPMAIDPGKRHRAAGLLALVLLLVAGPLLAQTRGVTVQAAGPSANAIELGSAYALIIGNNQYRHLPVLQTAVSDAAAVAELLRTRYDFTDVELLLNATRAEILSALNRYRRDLEPDDRLLIYYAGHGQLDREAERGYWLPIDAAQDNDIDWISNARITDLLKAMLARHVMVVADSCYSGALTRSVEAQPRPASDRQAWLSRMAASRARTALVSGGLEPVVDGGRNGHSVFASAFLDVLRENDDFLDGQSLFDRLKGRVVVNAAQTPAYGNVRFAYHEGGDFIFAPRGGSASTSRTGSDAEPAAADRSGTPCLLVWQGIADSERRSDYEAFLRAYPDCPMVPIARARLANLPPDTPITSAGPAKEPDFVVVDRDEVLVALRNANVRADPRADSRMLTTLVQGTKVSVTGRVGGRDWMRVSLADGQTGYIWAPLLGEQIAKAERSDDTGEAEVRARHILVGTRDDALRLLDEIRRGRDFAELAKAHSLGPSGARGGDLGYFRETDMVPEFGTAAFALAAGEVSQPVKTQFGWHLIKVEDRRRRAR